ncbi:hypothetical protein OROGR_002020 [Orobanche gracilis]
MGRGKLRVHLIPGEKARREGFKKRMKALEKAAHVLSTRCGVDIGMIIYGPAPDEKKKNFPDLPTVWPKNQESVVARLIESYKSRSGCDCSGSRNNNTYDLSDYFKEKTKQADDDLKKLREKTRISEPVKYPIPDGGDCCSYNCTSLEELKQFHGGLTAKIDAVRGRINLMKESIMSQYYSVDDDQESRGAYYAPPQQSVWHWNYDYDDQMTCYNEYSSIPGNMDDQMTMMTTAYNTENINNIGLSNFFDENFTSNEAYGFWTGTTMADVMNGQPMMSYNNNDAQYIEPVSVIWNEDF